MNHFVVLKNSCNGQNNKTIRIDCYENVNISKTIQKEALN